MSSIQKLEFGAGVISEMYKVVMMSVGVLCCHFHDSFSQHFRFTKNRPADGAK